MKTLKLTLLALAVAATAQAGGLVTNTNHSAAFLRDMARGTTTAVDAVYFNPAGTVFMKDGIHWGFNEQVAIQDRTINTSSDLFKLYKKNESGSSAMEFKQKTFSPVIPSIDFVSKSNKLALMASLSVGGGGGSLEMNDGLSTYVAQLGAISQNFIKGGAYDMDMYLKGTSITASLQFGAAYKLSDHFAVAAQIRSNIGYAKYDGHLKNFALSDMPMATIIESGVAAGKIAPELEATYKALFADKEVAAKQMGVAFSPNVAIFYTEGPWSYSGKYEFKSNIRLENDTETDGFGLFPDGLKVSAQMPALLTQALSYRFGRDLGYLKLTGEWHHFFDTDAHNSFTGTEMSGSNEYLFGAEMYVSPKVEVSAAYQRTVFSLDADKYNEMNFNMNSHSVGLGAAFAMNEKMKLNLGCMMTMYDEVENETEILSVPKTNKFDRHNVTLGVGLEYNF